MTAVIELTNAQLALVERTFDPQGRRAWLEVAAFRYLLGRL